MSVPPVDQPDWQNPQSGMVVYAPVLTGLVLGSGASSAIFDMSAYESVIVWSTTILTGGHDLLVMDPDGNAPLAILTSPPDALGNALPAHMIPVHSQRIQFTNNAAVAVTINVRATSRLIDRIDGMSRADADSFAIALPAAAGVYPLGYLRGSGDAFAYFELSINTIAGFFELAQGAITPRLAQHGELIAGPGGVRTITKSIIVPAGAPLVQFRANTAIAGTARFDVCYSG